MSEPLAKADPRSEQTIAEIYARGREELSRRGYARVFAPDTATRATLAENRRRLDGIFFRPRFLRSVKAATATTLFGVPLRTPVFCSPMSGFRELSDGALVDIAVGVRNAGSLLMLGIGGSEELQRAIDTGVPVVKIIKPYRRTELLAEKLRDAERRGCVAVGMDIDHFHGVLRDGRVAMTDVFAPQEPDALRRLIASTRLPFVVKGVLSAEDAREAQRLGAAAVIVSSHGVSSLDYAIPPIVALPDVAKAAGDALTVLVDTGFKTGNDVVKALAFGARAVGLAGALILAWGAGGASGVETLLERITAEAGRTMAVVGCARPSAADPSMVVELLSPSAPSS